VRAAVLRATGGPEALRIEDVDEPIPGEGEALLDVRAAGINFMDVLIRRGLYPQMPELPFVPGVEVAGDVDGEPSIGLVRASGGGYAERVAVPRQWLFPLPKGASYVEGASFLMTFLTAWIPLTRQARITPGTRVLVTAAAGGVGSAALQLVRTLGGRPVGAASTTEKLDVLRGLGFAELVTYDELEELAPVEVVLDPVGGDLLERCLARLKPLGVAIAIGYAGGSWPALDTARLVGRNLGVIGLFLGRLMQREPELVREAARDVLRLWEGGSVRPLVGAEFPLDEVAAAHALVEERRSTGKVVLLPRPPEAPADAAGDAAA
jgi:NADPH2:quinone reductase